MKKRFPFFVALFSCIIFISACKKSADTQMQNDSIEGSYTATGYFFSPGSGGEFSTQTKIIYVQDSEYKAYLPDKWFDSTFDFYFRLDSSTNYLQYINSDQPALFVPQSGFFTTDNSGGFDYSKDFPNAPGTPPWLQTTYRNIYDPATKTFWLHYGFGTGAANPQTEWPQNIYEKLVKQ